MNPLIQKIILATDFSEACQDVIIYAKLLCESPVAELKILHVFEPSGWMVPSPYYYTPGFEEWVDASIENTRQKGKEALKTLAESFGTRTETIFMEGDPSKEIVRVAAEQNADLLILSTHGYTGWNHLTLGSIAEYVVRHAPCPAPGKGGRQGKRSSKSLSIQNASRMLTAHRTAAIQTPIANPADVALAPVVSQLAERLFADLPQPIPRGVQISMERPHLKNDAEDIDQSRAVAVIEEKYTLWASRVAAIAGSDTSLFDWLLQQLQEDVLEFAGALRFHLDQYNTGQG